MTKLKKMLSVLLAAIMVLSLAACGNNADTKTTEAPAGTTEAPGTDAPEQTTEGGEQTTEAPVYEVTYPIDTDLTFTYWGLYPVAFDDLTKPYSVGLIENTGIALEVEYVKSADVATQYPLMIQRAELPNIVVKNFSSTELSELYADEAIWDLAPYLEEYAPDYWAYLNAEGNEDILRASKDSEGRILAVGSYLESEFNGTYIGPVIRQDWLDECGLKAPVTLEDWENVLVKFKEKYGAQLSFASNRWNVGIASGTGAFAGYKGDKLYVDDNGKIQYSAVQPEWKEMIEVLKKWNDMGLIDQDSFSQGDKDVRQKVMEGKVGVSITAMSQLTNWIADAKAEGGNGGNWVGFEYPRTAAGEATSTIQAAALKGTYSTIFTTSLSEDELKVALAWANYGFTEEGFIYQNFGKEGVAHTKDAEGNISYTDAVKGSSLSEFINDYVGTTSQAICGIQAADMVKLKNDPVAAEAVYKWIENTEALSHLLPTLNLSEEDAATYATKFDAITKKVATAGVEFILGQQDIANFDAFVAEIESMGLQEVLDIQQKAYDEYLAR